MISLSRKDKSLLLLIAIALIFLWLLTSIISSFINDFTFKNSDITHFKIQDDSLWINTSRAIDPLELKNRIVILHFWNQSCVSCNHGIQQLNDLAKKMENRVVIIGIHSAKFSNESNKSTIRKAVLRHEIDHPTVIDQDHKIEKFYKIDEWPTYLLFNNSGDLVKKYRGANSVSKLIKKAEKLVNKNKFSLEKKKLPIILEKNNFKTNVLAYPTKMIYVQNLHLKNRQFPALIIADSGNNSVLITSLNGEIILKIGSEIKGFRDGTFNQARFNYPQGLLYDGKNLFIADTKNHAIRLVDLEKKSVRTIIGSGIIGGVFTKKILDASKADLSYPTDLELFPNNSQLVISNAGNNQILTYDLNEKSLRPIAGDGRLENKDGVYPNNSLSQTADMAAFNGKLYLIDSLSSSLRQLEKDYKLTTLASGEKINQQIENNQRSMQSPQAIHVDDTGIYIADSLNHKIKKYDFNTMQISDLFGSIRGNEVGTKLTFDEPKGLVAMLDRIYIADTNNNRIIVANRGSKDSELLDVIPTFNVQKDSLLEFNSISNPEPKIQVKLGKKIAVKIKLNSGWKLNELAPSYLNILELKDDTSAILLQNFDSDMVKNNQIEISNLKDSSEYVLQGKIYYCRNVANSLCYVKNYQRSIEPSTEGDSTKIEIDLGN